MEWLQEYSKDSQVRNNFFRDGRINVRLSTNTNFIYVVAYLSSSTGVGYNFTRRARFGKTVEAAGRTLIGKQGEDPFFFGDHGPRPNVISQIRGFHLVFYSNFAPLRLIF